MKLISELKGKNYLSVPGRNQKTKPPRESDGAAAFSSCPGKLTRV